jgi:hypothetical protein
MPIRAFRSFEAYYAANRRAIAPTARNRQLVNAKIRIRTGHIARHGNDRRPTLDHLWSAEIASVNN